MINERREVLLVKNVIATHSRWVLPGGGVNFRESPQAAARREIYEETGIDVALVDLRVIRTVPRGESKLPYVAIILTAQCQSSDLPNRLHNPHEIAVAEWFSAHKLPADTSGFTQQAIGEVLTV